MIRVAFAVFTLLAATPLAAQNAQEQLDTRYDRALAAGYKALFLCSAIANAERNGATRTPESVLEWELTGIQSPLDEIVGELPFEIVRLSNDGQIARVAVSFSDIGSPRFAVHETDHGCSLRPTGYGVGQDVVEEVAAAKELGSILGSDAATSKNSFLLIPVSQSNKFERPVLPIDVVLDGAFSNRYGADSRTTVASIHLRGIEDGLAEIARYRAGFEENTPQRTWSVAKSIAATIVGAAVHRGDADVNSSAGLGMDETDPRRVITIDHLLRMASGRYSDTPGNRTDPLYFGGSTVEETALHWPLIEQPGTSFRYANNDTLAAIKAIEETFEAHPPADFFAKVGMGHTVAETDWRGDYILSSQVWATAGDLAKLGQLYLDDGVHPSGERILPEGWVEYVSSPSGPQPGRGCIGYGASWWLLNSCEGIPPDTIAAMGNRGQYVVVVPSRDVVIVRRGEDPAGGTGFDIVAFTRDVLAALEN